MLGQTSLRFYFCRNKLLEDRCPVCVKRRLGGRIFRVIHDVVQRASTHNVTMQTVIVSFTVFYQLSWFMLLSTNFVDIVA